MTVLFLFIILISFTVQSLTGFGGPLIAMPLGISVVGVATAKPIVTLAAWLSAAIIAVKNRRDIDYKELFKMSGAMLVFMIAGLWLFKNIKMSYLQVIYGIIVILIGLKKLFFPSEKPMPGWLAAIAICAAGIMQGLFVSGGSFLVIYAVSAVPEKKRFRATLSGVWAIVNILLLVSYALDGSFTKPVLTTAAWSLIPILGAVFIGGKLAGRLNQKTFLKVAYLLLVVSGAILLITNL